MEKFENFKSIVQDLETDIDKHDNGNKAAGTRARIKLQELKRLAQEMRCDIQHTKKDC
jgi:Histone H1-like protein Hc1